MFYLVETFPSLIDRRRCLAKQARRVDFWNALLLEDGAGVLSCFGRGVFSSWKPPGASLSVIAQFQVAGQQNTGQHQLLKISGEESEVPFISRVKK